MPGSPADSPEAGRTRFLRQRLAGEHPAGGAWSRSVPSDSMRITVGKFLAIRTGRSSVVSVITDVDTGGQKPAGEAGGPLTARVDLLGELKESKGGAVRFQRGITEYPVIGDAGRSARQATGCG